MYAVHEKRVFDWVEGNGCLDCVTGVELGGGGYLLVVCPEYQFSLGRWREDSERERGEDSERERGGRTVRERKRRGEDHNMAANIRCATLLICKKSEPT